MKALKIFLCSLFLMAAPLFATTYISASFSGLFYTQAANGNVTPTVYSTAVIIAKVRLATGSTASPALYAIGLEEGVGDLWVLEKGVNGQYSQVFHLLQVGSVVGLASNTAGTIHDNASGATINIPTGVPTPTSTVAFSSSQFASTVTAPSNGSLHSAHVSFFGGTGSDVLKGTYTTTGRTLTGP